MPVSSQAAAPLTPFSIDFSEAIKRAVAAVPAGDHGQFSFGVSLDGLELAAGWKPSRKIWVGGVVETLWSGRLKAGVKGQIIW